jgi:hypothetical protein
MYCTALSSQVCWGPWRFLGGRSHLNSVGQESEEASGQEGRRSLYPQLTRVTTGCPATHPRTVPPQLIPHRPSPPAQIVVVVALAPGIAAIGCLVTVLTKTKAEAVLQTKTDIRSNKLSVLYLIIGATPVSLYYCLAVSSNGTLHYPVPVPVSQWPLLPPDSPTGDQAQLSPFINTRLPITPFSRL